MIAFGCNALLNSKKPVLIINIWRTIFTPPEVDPDDPPKNMSPKNIIVTIGAHWVKS